MRFAGVAGLVVVGFLALLTIEVIRRQGLDLFVVLSLLVLAILGFGIFGALRHPDR
jgi:uncharacterized protein involved in cysteine biosynthesis